MKKIAMLSLAVLALLSNSLFADVTIEKKVHDRGNHTMTQFRVNGAGPFVQLYSLHEFNLKDGSKSLANNMNNVCGLGYGWFSPGMISATLNRRIALLPLPYKIIEEKDGFHYTFAGKNTESDLRFTFNPANDYVLLGLKVKTTDPVNSLVVKLFARPGHSGNTMEGPKPYKRHYVTAQRTDNLGAGMPALTLDAVKENWVVFYDEYNDSCGSSVLVYDPADFKSVKIGPCGKDLLEVTLELAPGKTDFKVLVRGIPETYLEVEEVIAEMKQKAPAMLQFLKDAKK